jgi:hypothetical protein
MSDRDQRYYQKNKEKENARSRAYYAANREDQIEKAKARNLLRQYGITKEQRDQMAASQSGKCAVCGLGKKLHIDHDHSTGKVRAMLCDNCNKGIGMFMDDPQLLSAAAQYVFVHSGVIVA